MSEIIHRPRDEDVTMSLVLLLCFKNPDLSNIEAVKIAQKILSSRFGTKKSIEVHVCAYTHLFVRHDDIARTSLKVALI